MKTPVSIFISYRRDDTREEAIALQERLAREFDGPAVFLDTSSLGPGKWTEQLGMALEQCQIVLVIIGLRWLAPNHDNGTSRLQDPDDVHRQEIEVALGRSGITVIPILIGQAELPRREDLPPSIRALLNWQVWRLPTEGLQREVDLARLVEKIRSILPPRPPTPPPQPSQVARVLRIIFLTLVTTLALVVAAQVGLGWMPSREEMLGIAVIASVVATLLALRRGRGGDHA